VIKAAARYPWSLWQLQASLGISSCHYGETGQEAQVWPSSIFLKTLRDYQSDRMGHRDGVGRGADGKYVKTLVDPEGASSWSALPPRSRERQPSPSPSTRSANTLWKMAFIFLIAVWPILAAGRCCR
jgi:hypothetical protein